VGVAVGDGTQDQLVEEMGSDYQVLGRSTVEPPPSTGPCTTRRTRHTPARVPTVVSSLTTDARRPAPVVSAVVGRPSCAEHRRRLRRPA